MICLAEQILFFTFHDIHLPHSTVWVRLAYIHTYNTYIHTHTHSYIHTFIHTYVCRYVGQCDKLVHKTMIVKRFDIHHTKAIAHCQSAIFDEFLVTIKVVF